MTFWFLETGKPGYIGAYSVRRALDAEVIISPVSGRVVKNRTGASGVVVEEPLRSEILEAYAAYALTV